MKTTLYLEEHVAVEEQCCIITRVASHGKVLMEKIWGSECCWHFPKGLPPTLPRRTYLLMLVVMMGCQQRDKVLWVNHGPLQWSRSTDGWPWWTLGCNRETKTDHEKKTLFCQISKNQRFIFIEMHLLLQGCVSAGNVTHTEMCVCCHVVRSLWFQRRSTFSCLSPTVQPVSVIDAGTLGAELQNSVDLWINLMNAYAAEALGITFISFSGALCWKLFLEQYR